MKFKIFLHDVGSNLKNLSSNVTNISSTTVLAEKGMVEDRKNVSFQWANYINEKK